MSLNHVLGKVPMIQVIDFMMEYMEYDCTVKEIIDHTGVGPTDMKRDFPGLVESGVVTETRKIAGVQLYRLNDVNVVTEALFELDRVLSDDVPEVIVDNSGEKKTADDEEEYLGPDVEELLAMPEDPEKYPESEEVWDS
jgi:hypothetical protein